MSDVAVVHVLITGTWGHGEGRVSKPIGSSDEQEQVSSDRWRTSSLFSFGTALRDA